MNLAEESVDESRWRIATCLHGVAPVTPNGEAMHDASPEVWADVFSEIAGLGFGNIELPDSHLRLADADPVRADEIFAAARQAGLEIPSVHIQRRSILQPGLEHENLEYAHRSIDAAARQGVEVFSTGLHQPLTSAQLNSLWFWLVQGPKDSDIPEVRKAAVQGFKSLGSRAADFGMKLSLEMYEDTLLGTSESAVLLIEEIDLANVGLNPDVGNIVRLHRPVEDWRKAYLRMLPYANYWHLKNYLRDEPNNGLMYTSSPSSLETGVIDYRFVIKEAVRFGFDGIFLMEHYGGDSLGMCKTNADYLTGVLSSIPHNTNSLV